MHISLVNRSSVVSDATLEAQLPAYRHYCSLVASAWNLKTPTVGLTSTPAATDWVVAILDDSDQANALGYHDYVPGEKPTAKIFAKTDKLAGASLSVTITHEIAEMIVDPWITCADQTSNTQFYAREVGDPVEDDSLGFSYTTTAGVVVLLSDYVLPAWFQPGAPGPYDRGRHCSAPLQVLAGGYAQFFENGAWNQVGPNGRREPMDAGDLRIRTRWGRQRTSRSSN